MRKHFVAPDLANSSVPPPASAIIGPMPFGSRTIALAPTWLGDTIMALPALEAIHEWRPTGVDILAAPTMERLLKTTRIFRLILPTSPSFFADQRLLKTAGYDEAFVLRNSFRSALLPFASRIPVRRGYATDRRGWLLSPSSPVPPRDRHQVFDYDELLATTGIVRESDVPKVTIPRGFLAMGRTALTEAGVDPSRPFVGLNPGGIGDPSKRWPIERFSDLARWLGERSIPAVVYSGLMERNDARRIADSVSPSLPVLGPDDDVLGLASLLAPCATLVTNDTGAMHLAAALGVPCLALFGPTDPGRTGPRGIGHRVVKRESMDAITLIDVVPELEALWDVATGDSQPTAVAPPG